MLLDNLDLAVLHVHVHVHVHLIEANAAIDAGTMVSLKFPPCRCTEPIPTGLGVLEGGGGSPNKFTTQISLGGLAAAASGSLNNAITKPLRRPLAPR